MDEKPGDCCWTIELQRDKTLTFDSIPESSTYSNLQSPYEAAEVIAVDYQLVVKGVVGGDVFTVDGSRGSVAVGVSGAGLDDAASLFDPDQASPCIVGIAVRDLFAPFSGVVSAAI